MYIVFVSRDGRQWLCTFCVFKINQEYFNRHEKSREEAMSCNISQHMLVRPLRRALFLFLCILLLFWAPLSPPCLIDRSVSIFSCVCAPLTKTWWLQTAALLWVSFFFLLNRSISPLFRSVWVFHHFSAAVGDRVTLGCLQGDKDESEHYRGKTPGGFLPHSRKVCVQLGARSHHIHFIQPGKTTVREALGFRKDQVLF